MGFTDPIVGGNGSLILPAIRSPNYVAGTAGWTINRDGSAEFADLIITGGEFRVIDPDGSYVRVYDQNPGAGAVIDLQPADIPGSTIAPAEILTYSTPGAPDTVSLALAGPVIDGTPAGSIFLSADNAGNSLTAIDGEETTIQTDHLSVFDTNSTPGFEVFPNQPSSSYLVLDGKTLGFGYGVVNQTPPTADTETSGTFQLMGNTSLAFTKKRLETRLVIRFDFGLFATAGGTQGEYGLRHAGGDITIGRFNLSATSQEVYPGATLEVSGLAAGAYTFQPIWRRTAGAGTLTVTAVSGTLSYSVQEVAEP